MQNINFLTDRLLSLSVWDLFLFVTWGALSVLYFLTARKGRIVNILLSTYIAKLLTVEALGQSVTLGEFLPSYIVVFQRLVFFGFSFLAVFFFLRHYALKSGREGNVVSGLRFKGLVFSCLQIGLLVSIVLNFLPQDMLSGFSGFVRLVFTGRTASLVWLVTPLVYVMVFNASRPVEKE